MKRPRWCFRWAGWTSAIFALLIACAILLSHHQNQARMINEFHGKQELKLDYAKAHVEHYLEGVWSCLQLVSADPNILKPDPSSQEHLRRIYNITELQHGLAEVQAIGPGLETGRGPLTTFRVNSANPTNTASRTPANEAATHKILADQIRRFAADASLQHLISDEVTLPIGLTGLVCSVPIRLDGTLVGAVAGLLTSEQLSRILGQSSMESTLLVNERGYGVASRSFPTEVRSRICEQLKAQGAGRAIPQQGEFARIGRYTLIWRPIEAGDSQKWYLTQVQDESAGVPGGGMAATAMGWSSAGLVLLLGSALVLLCRIAPEMIEARRHQEELAHVMRLGTMGEMATSLAHELSQFHAAILNYLDACSERIRSGRYDPAELLADIEHACTQAERATEVINHTRDFVRKREPCCSWVDINALVARAGDWLRTDAQESGVRVINELDRSLPRVMVDAIQIEQVIMNLMRNALDAMSSNAESPRELVVRTAMTSDGLIELSFRDTGAGLTAEAVEHAFEAFYTTKPHGMGMGLAISRTIVESHGGRIWAISNGDGGATFGFTLPIRASQASDAS